MQVHVGAALFQRRQIDIDIESSADGRYDVSSDEDSSVADVANRASAFL
jgi:hypothetical protein